MKRIFGERYLKGVFIRFPMIFTKSQACFTFHSSMKRTSQDEMLNVAGVDMFYDRATC